METRLNVAGPRILPIKIPKKAPLVILPRPTVTQLTVQETNNDIDSDFDPSPEAILLAKRRKSASDQRVAHNIKLASIIEPISIPNSALNTPRGTITTFPSISTPIASIAAFITSNTFGILETPMASTNITATSNLVVQTDGGIRTILETTERTMEIEPENESIQLTRSLADHAAGMQHHWTVRFSSDELPNLDQLKTAMNFYRITANTLKSISRAYPNATEDLIAQAIYRGSSLIEIMSGDGSKLINLIKLGQS